MASVTELGCLLLTRDPESILFLGLIGTSATAAARLGWLSRGCASWIVDQERLADTIVGSVTADVDDNIRDEPGTT